MAAAAVSHTGAGNRCDVAPSRFKTLRPGRVLHYRRGLDYPGALLCGPSRRPDPRALRRPRPHGSRAARTRFCCTRRGSLRVRRFARPRHEDRRRRLRTQIARRLSLHCHEPTLSRTGGHSRPSPAGRPAMESAWPSSRAPNGVRPRLAARLCMRTRGSLEKYGLRSALSGFARRSRRRATGSVGSSGRRGRARLAKTPFCASLAMRQAHIRASPEMARP